MPHKNTVVFILSSRRSGSTWTAYVLASHSQTAFLGEYHRAWHRELKVPCSLCFAKGEPECTVLKDIDEIPEERAFDFAFERMRKPILIDSTKWVEWANRFVHNQFQVKLIHLLRDPRGYFHSERRRLPREFWPGIVSHWVAENRKIIGFTRGSGRPSTRGFYEELAKNNHSGYDNLFRFLGVEPERAALEYWRKEHHGFAANGASSILLRGLPNPAFTTGDDSFYASVGAKNFDDRRWQTALSPEEKAEIESAPEVIDLLGECGAFMTAEGLRIDQRC